MGPAFNRLWASSLVSNLADGVLMVAAPLIAISLTDSTVLIAITGAMVMLPWLLFAIPIGAMVDRVDRRHILATSNAIRSAVVGAAALAIATDRLTIYCLIAAAFVIGICEVANDTTASLRQQLRCFQFAFLWASPPKPRRLSSPSLTPSMTMDCGFLSQGLQSCYQNRLIPAVHFLLICRSLGQTSSTKSAFGVGRLSADAFL
jgi:MFS family permease